MIQKLIDKTNTPEFYQDCDLKLESYNFKTSDRTFEIILSINQISYDEPIEYEEWKITCINIEKQAGFFWDIMLPYVKLKILENHPLLFEYQDDQLECEIKGTPENVNEYIGEMYNELEKITGNWIPINEHFWNLKEYYSKYSKKTISIPKSLKDTVKKVCEKHNLSFEINSEIIGNDKGYSYKPNSKLLMFGNEDVSPNDFNLHQPFIIAENFIAERIK